MRKLAFFLLLPLIAGCSSIKVKTQYNESVNFAQYESWCWLQGCEVVFEGPSYLYDTAVIATISNYIAQEMYEKGFTQKDENADLMVDFHIVVEEDSAIFSVVHEEDLPYWEDYQLKYYHFLRGTLIIDIIDREAGQVIWQASGERYMALFPEIDDKTVKLSVKKMLKKFPPEVKD
ncbi:MAG: DUF4136 domain-containing protein [Fulvivirga sp.]